MARFVDKRAFYGLALAAEIASTLPAQDLKPPRALVEPWHKLDVLMPYPPPQPCLVRRLVHELGAGSGLNSLASTSASALETRKTTSAPALPSTAARTAGRSCSTYWFARQ